MRKISLIIQEILKYFILFLLFFIWIRYFVRNLALSIILSIILSGILFIILYFFNYKKNNKNNLKIKEKENAENIFLSLACDDKYIDFFVKLASKKHKNITKHKSYIVVNHEDVGVKTLLYVDLSFDGLSIAKFIEIYNKIKKEKCQKIVICCKNIIDKNIYSFLTNFKEKIIILDAYDTYKKLYKYYDFYPEITKKYNNERKMVFKDFLAYSFNKKKTKAYLFSAFILILSSLFIPTTIYYCVIASILVVFALISQFNPYFNTKNDDLEII